MKKLAEIIRKNGYEYKQFQRTTKKAMYAQYYDNVLIAYEVFKIRVRGTQKSGILNRIMEPAEEFPGNEDFGKIAWTVMTYTDALKKYNEL